MFGLLKFGLCIKDVNLYLLVLNILILSCLSERKYSEYNQYTYILNNIEDDLTASQSPAFGQLTGDVQNWAQIIQNYILQVNFINEQR